MYCRHLKLNTFKIQFAYKFQTIRGKKAVKQRHLKSVQRKIGKEKKQLEFMVDKKKNEMAGKVQTHQ